MDNKELLHQFNLLHYTVQESMLKLLKELQQNYDGISHTHLKVTLSQSWDLDLIFPDWNLFLFNTIRANGRTIHMTSHYNAIEYIYAV